MYRSFFGLRDRPFDLTPNPRFLVLTDAHREALGLLEYGISGRRGIIVLLGDAGTGKTTVIRAALQKQPDHVHAVYLHNPALTRQEFVEMLAARFELSPQARSSKAAFLVELENSLRERHRREESSVLIVDEAQSVPVELLEEIRLLGNIETDDTKLLSIVMAGQPELATLLDQPSLRQFKQRVALRCELRPLTQAETAGYLAGRVRAAGGVGAQIFTREAVMLIHERSGGIPRTISVMADNALVSAYALGRKPINSEIIAEVSRDLGLQPAHDGYSQSAPSAPLRAPALTVRPERPRPLAIEGTSGADTHGPAGAPDPATESSSMFNTFSPKRRRFSLFKKSGTQ